MKIERKIEESGILLPENSAPKAMYVPVKQLGNALFVSGYVSTFASVVAYFAWNASVKIVGVGSVAAYINLLPVWTVINDLLKN
ncbi:hypothetical protein P4V86_17170 [Brevibacillus laterosporus]|uniref:hypothetical protein n=1 Tax=Brevibacillus laterosporus TaxID=1465 RepID=UPI000364FEFC|nr:hypothetical protein [Brevibacillus laterosporus]ATO51480.1 hypothetical protein BrL25_21695 [Brevibacillus laterosporus DSM 25]MBG9775963.1 hypothetical protein [Brevibacillus laterosporus]MBG9801547.1 hypothetical protein [Brevibacillus laterosporus]MED2005074.1 hypothetical protein [Brevibacillus laterosporus]MED4766265.1 hypothetical protein [Brevibacillus laterosporus]